MGCFLACFGSKKERRRRRKLTKRVVPKEQRNGFVESLQVNVGGNEVGVPFEPTICLNKDLRNSGDEPVSLEPTICLNKDLTENLFFPREDSRDKLDEQFSIRKKVTFDLNVKAYEEEISSQEIKDYESEEECDVKGREQRQLRSVCEDDLSVNGLGTFPSNHRYQNCSNSDDEYEAGSEDSDLNGDDDSEYSDEDDEDDHQERVVHDESSESFFSLPSDVQRQGSETPVAEKEVNSPQPGEMKTLRANQNTRNRNQCSVLNPVENLTQWKAIKMRSKPPLKPQKENTELENEVQIPFSTEPSFKLSPFCSSPKVYRYLPMQEDVAVDTSLSNWLDSPETTPSTKTNEFSVGYGSAEGSKSLRSNSPRFHEDRPILGALTVEEIRQFSTTSSPRKSPSRSPDDMPILGTVGSYWSHTGQTTDSSSASASRQFSATSSPRKSPSWSPDDMPILGTVGSYWSHTGQTTDSSSASSHKGIPNTTSKYREDNKVKWHSTPFETRLERALNKGEPEAYTPASKE